MSERAKARISDAIVSVLSYDRICEDAACSGECARHWRLAKPSSGVLITLAGREFVLASAHGVWDPTRGDFRSMIDVLGGERGGKQTAFTVGCSVLQAFTPSTRDECGYPDPDIALLELSEQAILRSTRRPYTEDEIIPFLSEQPRPVLFAGFPGGDLDELSSGVERFEVRPRVIEALLVESGANGQPERFLQVILEPELAAIDGMSGGPLVLPEGDGVLIGLTRQVVPDRGFSLVQFEPVTEAIRALTDAAALRMHRSPELASAAFRILARAVDATGMSPR